MYTYTFLELRDKKGNFKKEFPPIVWIGERKMRENKKNSSLSIVKFSSHFFFPLPFLSSKHSLKTGTVVWCI